MKMRPGLHPVLVLRHLVDLQCVCSKGVFDAQCSCSNTVAGPRKVDATFRQGTLSILEFSVDLVIFLSLGR